MLLSVGPEHWTRLNTPPDCLPWVHCGRLTVEFTYGQLPASFFFTTSLAALAPLPEARLAALFVILFTTFKYKVMGESVLLLLQLLFLIWRLDDEVG